MWVGWGWLWAAGGFGAGGAPMLGGLRAPRGARCRVGRGVRGWGEQVEGLEWPPH